MWLREVEVRFQNLNVTAPISVGSSGMPTILNSYKNTFQVLQHACCQSLTAACAWLGN